ncbi:MAG: proline dehydrogenase family protein [Candidatus Marsarchaeota archaeon]|nr:proline dehydrogenase family protein [Candidatus Marsarchaeota archaeon]
MCLNTIFEKTFAGTWIAGPNIEDAISEARKFNAVKIKSIINYLGEEFDKVENVDNAVEIYIAVIKEIRKRHIDSDISVKPTQLGMLINEKVFEANYRKILRVAKNYRIFIWLDMENAKYVGATIKAYLKGINGKNSGICIQAYLKRSMDDIKKIVAKKGTIRLVKGAYVENRDISYNSWEKTTENYRRLLLYLFEKSNNFTIATHDLQLIKYAEHLNEKYNKTINFAMLKGIKNRTLTLLAKKYPAYVYIPFGTAWLQYSIRRLREAGHLKLIFKSLLENQSIEKQKNGA